MKSAASIVAAAALVTGTEASNEFLNDVVESSIELAAKNGLTSGSIWKSCPKTQVVQDFDVEKYLGTWYELHRAYEQNQEDGECSMAQYTTRDDGLIGVTNSQANYKEDGTFGPRNGIQGKAQQYNPENKEAHLGVKFSDYQPIWGPYDVLYTDYDNIAIVHSCFSLGVWKMEQQWLLSRKPLSPDTDGAEYESIVNKAKEVLEGQLPNFKFEDHMRPVVQGAANKCEYYSPFEF